MAGTYVYNFGSGATADTFTVQVGPTAVPEPTSLALLVLPMGVAGVVVARRRRKGEVVADGTEDVQLTGGSWDATLPA